MPNIKQTDRYTMLGGEKAAAAGQHSDFSTFAGSADSDTGYVTSFSDCSELRRYLAFLTDESRSIKQLSDWLIREEHIILDKPAQIEDKSSLQSSFYEDEIKYFCGSQPCLPDDNRSAPAEKRQSYGKSQLAVSGDYRQTYNLLGQRKELLNLVIHNIARLHAAYRETLVSLYFEQLSMRETALLMGKSLSTIKRYRDAGILDLFFRLKHHELAQCQNN
ncbi:MAG TPA: hypothetical protein VFF56_03260 [Bacillota bacterium]|nr:hypothetical protein [Bacillota bacterium]